MSSMKTETLTIYRGKDGKFAPPPEAACNAHLFSKLIDWAIVAAFAFAALVLAYKFGAASMLPDPQPAPLLPHSAIAIPQPLDLPSWEIPAPVFYFYELPPAKRGITFNGNTR